MRCAVDTCRDLITDQAKRGRDGKWYCWSCGVLQ
jgi:hypothetical protein